ncbi:hypothetical protein [Coralloluteibacterium thermophilus]|uniref:Uncharacterized protein n=1 Tax=Coralloluteibacterium thermophilum TaxID=2707049 RepID=A0ABV9NMZ3_9GAMM
MPWILLLLALLCLAVGLTTTSIALAWIGLLAALVLIVVGVLMLADRRIAARSRDASTMFDADALQRFRAQAQAARNGDRDGAGARPDPSAGEGPQP